MARISVLRLVCLTLALILILAPLALAAGVDTCQAELSKKNKAWDAYVAADKAFQDSLGPLEKAFENLDKAEAAYKAAAGTVAACKASYDAADKAWVNCIEGSATGNCQAEERAMRSAKEKWDNAVNAEFKAFADIMIAQNDVKNAKAKQHQAYQKLKQARDAYDNAAAGYAKCLRGSAKA